MAKQIVTPIDPVSLPIFLKKRRQALGLTQEQVAERAGIHKSTYTRYELGKATPNLLLAGWVLGALGCDLELVIIRRT